jgi:hypothetical protein
VVALAFCEHLSGHRNFAADPHAQFEFDQSLIKYVLGEVQQPPLHFRMLAGSKGFWPRFSARQLTFPSETAVQICKC